MTNNQSCIAQKPGWAWCASGCVFLGNDPHNCQQCDTKCASGKCVNSACIPASASSQSSVSTSTSASAIQTTSSSSISPTNSQTQSTQSPTNTTSPSPGPTSLGVASGTAAGIGIGCAVAGALLAGLIVFFILSRRNRPQASYQQQGAAGIHPSTGGYMKEEKSGVTTTVANVDRLLPQPTEDDAMIAGLSKIRDAVKNHVQNYYHTAPVDPKIVEEAGLVELARVLAILTSGISDLLLNPGTRVPMLRLYLGHLILSRCSGQPDTTLSFLPSEVSAFAASDSGAKAITTAEVALFSKWKTISGTLLQQRYSQQPNGNDPREASIAEALTSSEFVLRPFVNPSIDTNVRRRNLEGIMRRAAQYAFLMFSQPSSFIFDYTRTGHPDSLVVFPALLITVNDEGKKLSPPRVLSEKEVVAGLGRH